MALKLLEQLIERDDRHISLGQSQVDFLASDHFSEGRGQTFDFFHVRCLRQERDLLASQFVERLLRRAELLAEVEIALLLLAEL